MKTYEHFSEESENSKITQQNQKNPKNESATKTCIRLHEMTTPLLRFSQKYRKYDKISENPTQKSQSRGDDNLWGEHKPSIW